MLEFDDKQIRKFEKDLAKFQKAIPIANMTMLNRTAFETRKISHHIIRNKMILRNKFALQSVRVEKAKPRTNINKQFSITGSTAEFMADQEFGAIKRSDGKKGVPIATTTASGEGENANVRKKLPKRVNKLQTIQLRRRRSNAKTKKQRNAIKIQQAIKNNDKFVYLETSRKKFIARVIKKGRKGEARIKMVWDLSRRTVRIPKNPWLKPATQSGSKKMPRFYLEALEFQVKRQKLFQNRR